MSAAEQGAAEAAEQDGRGSARVVIRGVQAIVLDDLPKGTRERVLEAVKDTADPQEAWIAVASQRGQVDVAVRAYAGQSGSSDAKAGTYKALPAGSWFAPATVIEPPLP